VFLEPHSATRQSFENTPVPAALARRRRFALEKIRLAGIISAPKLSTYCRSPPTRTDLNKVRVFSRQDIFSNKSEKDKKNEQQNDMGIGFNGRGIDDDRDAGGRSEARG
jgi:hypothetical protein